VGHKFKLIKHIGYAKTNVGLSGLIELTNTVLKIIEMETGKSIAKVVKQ